MIRFIEVSIGEFSFPTVSDLVHHKPNLSAISNSFHAGAFNGQTEVSMSYPHIDIHVVIHLSQKFL